VKAGFSIVLRGLGKKSPMRGISNKKSIEPCVKPIIQHMRKVAFHLQKTFTEMYNGSSGRWSYRNSVRTYSLVLPLCILYRRNKKAGDLCWTQGRTGSIVFNNLDFNLVYHQIELSCCFKYVKAYFSEGDLFLKQNSA
jgi:hypothetical protein